MNFFSRFFKKKNTDPEPVPQSFYGIICTNHLLNVNPENRMEMTTILEKMLYKKMDIIFFDFGTFREYIVGRLAQGHNNYKMYMYGITIHPKDFETEKLLKDNVDNFHRIYMDQLEDRSVEYSVIEDLRSPKSIKYIQPGIETLDEFDCMLSMGYDALVKNRLIPKYNDRFYQHSDDSGIFDQAYAKLSPVMIMDIWDKAHTEHVTAEEQYDHFKKRLVDQIVSRTLV